MTAENPQPDLPADTDLEYDLAHEAVQRHDVTDDSGDAATELGGDELPDDAH
jgi:hypothetical protein